MRLPSPKLAFGLLLVLGLPLAACSNADDGTSVSVKDERGKTVVKADGDSGNLKLDVPGFQGKITLPKIKLDADNLDLNGVRLYPGTTINDFDVQAGGGGGKGGVTLRFTSPAEPATVRDWLAERLNKADYRIHAAGTGLLGRTNENQPFRLTLEPAGDHHARGVLTIG